VFNQLPLLGEVVSFKCFSLYPKYRYIPKIKDKFTTKNKRKKADFIKIPKNFIPNIKNKSISIANRIKRPFLIS